MNTVDLAVERARQIEAANNFANDIMIVSSSEAIGSWIRPPGYENMHFIRCGAKTYEGGMPPMCAVVYWKHKGMGAGDAPKGMRPPVGFEADGDRGVYIFYFPETWETIQNTKKKIQNHRQSRSQDFGELVGDKSGLVKIQAEDIMVPARRNK